MTGGVSLVYMYVASLGQCVAMLCFAFSSLGHWGVCQLSIGHAMPSPPNQCTVRYGIHTRLHHLPRAGDDFQGWLIAKTLLLSQCSISSQPQVSVYLVYRLFLQSGLLNYEY